MIWDFIIEIIKGAIFLALMMAGMPILVKICRKRTIKGRLSLLFFSVVISCLGVYFGFWMVDGLEFANSNGHFVDVLISVTASLMIITCYLRTANVSEKATKRILSISEFMLCMYFLFLFFAIAKLSGLHL